MIRATIFLTMGWLLASGAPGLVSNIALAQAAPAQTPSQPSAKPGAAVPASPEVASPKPCAAGSGSQSASPTDCKAASKTRKPKRSAPAASVPGSGPRTRVVDNGNTTDPDLDISPGVNPQQAQQQRGRTTWLLGKTNENLKSLSRRELNAAQQETVDQVKRYVEDSEAATKSGDLQRAYTLANKARMLSADLVKH